MRAQLARGRRMIISRSASGKRGIETKVVFGGRDVSGQHRDMHQHGIRTAAAASRGIYVIPNLLMFR